MTVEKIIITKEREELNIVGATLLSTEEAETLLSREERKYEDWWRLRSPGTDSSHAAGVDYLGSVNYFGLDVYRNDVAVRPALQIKDLRSSNLKVGDRFEFGGKLFRIISDELAFCEEDIGYHRFDAETNVYEQSEIKKFVDAWFEKAKAEA